MLGWGGGNVNVLCTCRQDATQDATQDADMLDATQDAGTQVIDKMWGHLMISCPSPSIISPKQPDWSMIRSGSICTVGNGDKMRARTCGPTCTKCLLSEKKDAADSLLKFQRALNADATLFSHGFLLCTYWFPYVPFLIHILFVGQSLHLKNAKKKRCQFSPRCESSLDSPPTSLQKPHPPRTSTMQTSWR